MPTQDSAKPKSTPAVSAIFSCLYESPEAMTKQEVADACGLSLPTVYQGFSQLQAQGLIKLGDDRSSTGGRRAQTFTVDAGRCAAIGISLTGRSARCIACDLYGEKIEGLYIKRPLPARRTGQTLAETIKDIAKAMASKLEGKKVRPVGIGIAVPSAIDPATGRLLNTSVLKLEGERLCASDLTSGLPYPAAVFNDANCGGFCQTFLSSEDASLAYLSLERGVGGAVIIGGRPFEGPKGISGEFGHIRIVPGGKTCACGQDGCLEAYCSSNVLSEERGCTIDEFFAGVKAGSTSCVEALDEYISHLAQGIQAIHTMLGCDVCLGGELAEYLSPYYDKICEAEQAIDPFPSSGPCVVIAKHPFHGVPIGAAQLMVQRFTESV